MSLLTMIQETADRLSLPRPSTVIGNTDPQVQTLLATANEEGRKLSRAGPWQELTVEATFTTVDQQTEYELETIAPGWDTQKNPTMWDRTGQNLINGPITPAEYQTDVAYLPMNIYFEWRVRQDNLVIYPPPSGGLEVAFEYATDRWCKNITTGTLQDEWLDDTDVGLIPEWLMSLGIEWRFNQRTGFVEIAAGQRQEYESEVRRQISQGVQGRTLDLTGKDLFRQRRVPWGNWSDYA